MTNESPATSGKAARASGGDRVGDRFKLLIHYARSSGSGKPRHGDSFARPAPGHNQRCAVRIVYSKNAGLKDNGAPTGDISPETATLEPTSNGAGFTAEARDTNIAAELERWQAARDPLLWKLIISPESATAPTSNGSPAI